MARGHFAKSEKQAASVMRELQGKGNVIESCGSVRNYEQALKTACDYLKEYRLGALREMTPEIAKNYLDIRAQECAQSTVDMDRQALEKMMQHVTNKLDNQQKLPIVKSQLDTTLSTRSYTPAQIKAILAHQRPQQAFTTQLCYAAGLRAQEVYTLRKITEVTPSPGRKIHTHKFSHLPQETQRYTVKGKGGLIREVQIPNDLAKQLESYRLAQPTLVKDRNIYYRSHYQLTGGHKFSDAFSKASLRALGYSNGAHGLRHTYAQDRYEQLANYHSRNDVMEIISQELGHFRPEITEVYLR